jgi:hypothetical protein
MSADTLEARCEKVAYPVTYGKRDKSASVMPKPARRMGVSPTLGLIVVPVKGPTGVCWVVSSAHRKIKSLARIRRDITHTLKSLLFQIACSFNTQDQAYIMNTLPRTLRFPDHITLQLLLTSRKSFELVLVCRNCDNRAFTKGCERTWYFLLNMVVRYRPGTSTRATLTGQLPI